MASRRNWLLATAVAAPVVASLAVPAARDGVLGALAPSAAAEASAGRLEAVLDERKLYVATVDGESKTYSVAIGTPRYPTPTGTFRIRRIVWNPAWVPPASPWAKGKRARGPGDPQNPMKVAKIFFKEPDYYIHGTGHIESLGSAASHGCLRMHPDEVAELGATVMRIGGVSHDWDWVKRTLRVGEARTINLKRPVQITIVPRREQPASPPADMQGGGARPDSGAARDTTGEAARTGAPTDRASALPLPR